MGARKDAGGGKYNRLSPTEKLASSFDRNNFKNRSPGSRTESFDYSPFGKPRPGEKKGAAADRGAGNVGEECLKGVKGSF